MRAVYVFRARFRLDPEPGVGVDPQTFETVVEVAADEPGTGEWLRFRDALWRGEVNDERYARELAEGWLSVPVESVSFREFRTDEAYLAALREAIDDELALFNADSVREVLHKYFGSSVRVEDDSA